jgi:hypothetical protein
MFGKDLQRKVGSIRRYRIRKESKDRSNKSNHIMRGNQVKDLSISYMPYNLLQETGWTKKLDI